MENIMAGLIAYLIGNLSSAYFIVKIFKNDDIRNYGSGNPGATNALRVYGKKIGALTLILDLLKGLVAVYIGGLIGGDFGKFISGIAVVLGHDWPVLLGFKGGKGIATSIGVLLAINPLTALACLLLGLPIIIISRYVSLGSVSIAALLPLIGYFTKRPFDKRFLIMNIVLGLLALFKHRSNIGRLLRKEERKL